MFINGYKVKFNKKKIGPNYRITNFISKTRQTPHKYETN